MDNFIRTEDYGVVIGESALKALSQAGEASRTQAELQAIEEIAGYLRPTYDTERIFAADTPQQRNPLLVGFACDIALYHLTASLPQKMGAEVRHQRYERAIAWLTDVQRGRIIPNLPKYTATKSGEEYGQMRWHSQPKQGNTW